MFQRDELADDEGKHEEQRTEETPLPFRHAAVLPIGHGRSPVAAPVRTEAPCQEPSAVRQVNPGAYLRETKDHVSPSAGRQPCG